ncbi:hypothetical protein PSP6_220024 [Paraburkholderia tropica]|nr:hypothetical protein PSP6_220024 [Paraburkholderia tropica]
MACRGRSGGLPRLFSFWPSILCQAGKDPCEKPTESGSLIEEFFSGTDRFGGCFPGRLVGYWSCCNAQNDRRRTGMRCGYRLPCELLEGAMRRSSADCACAQKQKDAREDAPDWIAGGAVVTAAIGGLVAIIGLAPRVYRNVCERAARDGSARGACGFCASARVADAYLRFKNASRSALT